MSSGARRQALAELGAHVLQVVGGTQQAWASVRSGDCSDPVALDRFGLYCVSASAALGQLGERAHELAESLLDDDD